MSAARAADPMRVQIDRGGSDGLLSGLLAGVWRVLVVVVLLVWRAPLLALAGITVVGLVVAVVSGAWPLALLVVAALLVLTGGVCLVWRGFPRAFAGCVYGQVLRVGVYRPRWDTACAVAGLTVRAGSLVHTPRLVRHRRADGLDVLSVHCAPGQTVEDWRAAATSLASSFSAYSVAVAEGARPGWVRLEVLRRDPLGCELVAGNPARAGAGPVVLGRDEYGHAVTVDPYGTPHVALQGATRSGKSAASYTLLAALAHRPDVIVCGVDPSGILLAPFERGPGAAYIATGTRAEDIARAADVLARLVALMDERVSTLRRAGSDKLTLFTASMPAVWVVLEEYPGLIAAAKALDAEQGTKPGQRIAPRLERSLGRIIKEGAKVGVIALVIAQRMSADALATDDRSNIALRITLRVDNSDAVRMLHDGVSTHGIDTVRRFAPGIALVESPGQPLRRVRFAYTDYPTYRERVTDGLARHRTDALTAPGTLGGHLATVHAAKAAPLPVITPTEVA